MDPVHMTQLDRIETKVDRVVSRVDKLEAKASMWGAIGSVVVMVLTRLAGCV